MKKEKKQIVLNGSLLRPLSLPSLHVPFSAGGCQSVPYEIGRMCVKGL